MSPEDQDADLRYAEYVIGVLDADGRALVAREVETSAQAAAAVLAWEGRLLPLVAEIPEVPPPPHVWIRLRDALGLGTVFPRPRGRGLWDNLPLWHGIGLGASAVAAAAILLLLWRPAGTPNAVGPSVGYLVSALQQESGATGWTATLDVEHGRVVVVPAASIPLESGRAPELWLIPRGQKPIALGMIANDHPTTIAIPASTLARIADTGLLAVSVEPLSGSPTGQPTGPVIAKGVIAPSTTTTAPPGKASRPDVRPDPAATG